MGEDIITIPIMKEDGLMGLIRAFLNELRDRKIIWISNGTEGDCVMSSIYNVMEESSIIRKISWNDWEGR